MVSPRVTIAFSTGNRRSRVPIRGIPAERLETDTWYLAALCVCGRQIVVCEDATRGQRCDYLTFHRLQPIQCECGQISLTGWFRKIRIA